MPRLYGRQIASRNILSLGLCYDLDIVTPAACGAAAMCLRFIGIFGGVAIRKLKLRQVQTDIIIHPPVPSTKMLWDRTACVTMFLSSLSTDINSGW